MFLSCIILICAKRMETQNFFFSISTKLYLQVKLVIQQRQGKTEKYVLFLLKVFVVCFDASFIYSWKSVGWSWNAYENSGMLWVPEA